MNKLTELLERYCPKGVKYKSLGDIGNVSMCKRILKSQTNNQEGIPFYKIGTFGGEPTAFISEDLFLEYKDKYPYPKVGDVLISAAGTIGRAVIFDGTPSYYQDSNIVWVDNDESQVLNKFLYYFYQTKPWSISTGGTISRLYNSNIEKTQVPVPALPVQREIVHLLDKFSMLSAELTVKLETELADRKQQYEYYRDELFSFEEEVERCKLSEICELITGATPNTKKKEYWDNGTIPWMSSGEVNKKRIFETESKITELGYKNASTTLVPPKTVVVALAGQGKTRGKVAITEIELCTNQSLCSIVCGNKILPEYLYYYLDSKYEELRAISNGDGTRGGLSLRILNPYVIPVPTIKRQKRIIEIFSRFNPLINDISDGLSAEIEARQKQYEYYRDKLLDFKRKERESSEHL